jgi:hypothetical protein
MNLWLRQYLAPRILITLIINNAFIHAAGLGIKISVPRVLTTAIAITIIREK